MKKRPVIPPVPEAFVLDDQSAVLRKNWITYFQNMSERIKIVVPRDEQFDLEKWHKAVRSNTKILEEGKVLNWPSVSQIAFVISINSASPEHEARYVLENTFIFCYYGRAFGLDYFAWDGDGEEDPYNCNYSLAMFSESALSWDYITKIIQAKLINLSKSVPKLRKKIK